MLPFKYHVTSPGITLSQIAHEHFVSCDDLWLWNPTFKDLLESRLSTVPVGTYVQLPPALQVRGNAYGESFLVNEFAERLQATLSLQKELLGEYLSDGGNPISATVFIPPTPKILPRKEMLRESIAQEAVAFARTELTTSPSTTATENVNLNLEPLKLRIQQADNLLDFCQLECLKVTNEQLMRAIPHKGKPNHVNDDRLYTVKDQSDKPIDRQKDVRLVFSFFELRSLYTLKESWAVISSQCIGTLIDALRCKTMLIPPYKDALNRFLFIGGTFYIDDRVPASSFADITEELRSWDPVQFIVSRYGENSVDPQLLSMKRGYGVCPVKRVSETTFGDLRLKMNEFCVFRHCGNCDHIFYLSHCGLVPLNDCETYENAAFISPEVAAQPLTSTSQFPRRVRLAPDRTVNCDVCSMIPASIATYGDSIAPFSPALFCLPCFRVAHCDKNGQEIQDGYHKLELPRGEFF